MRQKEKCARIHMLNERSCSTFPIIKVYAEEADELNVPALDIFFSKLIGKRLNQSRKNENLTFSGVRE
jgi:hypothetical protein